MEIDIQETDVDCGCIPIEYDANGLPIGITVDELFDKLGNKLIAHYGEDFRVMLNVARAERGLLPL